jgi:hypothetical protein
MLKWRAKNIFEYLFGIIQVIRSQDIGSPIKQSFVLVEIIPHEIRNIISKAPRQIAEICGATNNTSGYKTQNDAINDTQNIGFCLLKYIKPENLFLVFSERLEVLQSSLFGFLDANSVPYRRDDIYNTIEKRKCDEYDKSEAEPLGIILCKVINIDILQESLWSKFQESSKEYPNCYKISWGKFQGLQNKLSNCGPHIYTPKMADL